MIALLFICAGLDVSVRYTAESKFPEVKIEAKSTASPEAVIAAIWVPHDDPESLKRTKLRRFLKKTPTERITYEQLTTPVIEDRDLVVRLRLLMDPVTHVHQILFQTVPEGPAPAPGYTRIPLVRGSYTVEPGPDGKTLLTYVCLNDPGGMVPAFVAKGAQIDAAEKAVANNIAYAEAHPTGGTAEIERYGTLPPPPDFKR